jgi:branched-chain amino acid transport system ATP-binding protein
MNNMLSVKNIDTYYGSSQALFGISLDIGPGEVVSLLGRNGMGKSTTVKSIMGLQPVSRGTISFDQTFIEKLQPFQIARHGIGLVPEGRLIFSNLTVSENIVATASNFPGLPAPYKIDDILTIFPRLSERLNHFGSQLSGGEQQMLAIGRALMINPRLIILDEATEGLAPLIRKEIWRGLQILKEKGLSILIIDKNIEALLSIAQRHYIMEKGQIVWSGTSEQFRSKDDLKPRYLGI